MQLAHALRKLVILALLVGTATTSGIESRANGFEGVLVQSGDYHAGIQAYRHGDYVRAINFFKKVLTQEPGSTNAHYYMGLSFDNLNMSPQAVQEYQYVVSHGQEQKIVNYAQTRLRSLKGEAPLANHAEKTQDIAMVAAGNPLPTKAYRGTVAQVAVPLKSNRNALMVDAILTQDDTRAIGTFIIDTGATYTSISQELAEQMGIDLKNAEKVYITTANGRIEVPKVKIEKLSVNGLEAHNVEATVIQVRPGSSFAGLLGLSFIRQFVVTIDPQANQLIFQKN